MPEKISIVGTGLVGRAWAMVFARAGFDAHLYDPVDGAAQAAIAAIEELLPDLEQNNLLGGKSTAEVRGHIHLADSLEAALADSRHVQESAPERVEVKRELYANLDRLAAEKTILASSTSGIPASKFSETLAHRHRCLVAHPINPPHIIPLVEIIPSPWTDPGVVAATRALMADVGQRPISTSREINGFIVNRLQGALLSEAFRLVEDGVCSVEDVDAAIADGLGLRWSFIGPFETIDLNSPQGVAGYCDMLGQLYYDLAVEQADPRPWSAALVEKVAEQRRKSLSLADLPARQAWRDRRLTQLVLHKRHAESGS